MTVPLDTSLEHEPARLRLGGRPLDVLVSEARLRSGLPDSGIVQALGAAAAVYDRAINVGRPEALDQVIEEPLAVATTDRGLPEDVMAVQFLHAALQGVHINLQDGGLSVTSFVTAQHVASRGLLGVRFTRTTPAAPNASPRHRRGLLARFGFVGRLQTSDLAVYSVSAGFIRTGK